MVDHDVKERLEALRDKLRTIDDEIMAQVISRAVVVREIGTLKRDHHIDVLDKDRETFNRLQNSKITEDKLPAGFSDELSELLAKWSRKIQSQC